MKFKKLLALSLTFLLVFLAIPVTAVGSDADVADVIEKSDAYTNYVNSLLDNVLHEIIREEYADVNIADIQITIEFPEGFEDDFEKYLHSECNDFHTNKVRTLNDEYIGINATASHTCLLIMNLTFSSPQSATADNCAYIRESTYKVCAYEGCGERTLISQTSAPTHNNVNYTMSDGGRYFKCSKCGYQSAVSYPFSIIEPEFAE